MGWLKLNFQYKKNVQIRVQVPALAKENKLVHSNHLCLERSKFTDGNREEVSGLEKLGEPDNLLRSHTSLLRMTSMIPMEKSFSSVEVIYSTFVLINVYREMEAKKKPQKQAK